jgi:hypothetical protein
MTWINSLSTMQWIVLASIPPLIISLYFLKLKRSPIEVPSTYLWRKAIEDSHVNSLWQRLRRSVLLLLQLLFVAAIIIACLRPGWSSSQTIGQRSILLVDNSASMTATDVTPSRLDVAKTKAKELVRAMTGNDVAMVIAFSDRADVRQGFTGDRNRLIAAIDDIPATSRTTDLNEAMRAAAGLANPGRVSFDGMNDIQVAEALPATVSLFSDGGFLGLSDFNLGNLSIRYVPIGSNNVNNVAIEAFSILRNEERPDEIQAYARVASYDEKPIEVGASLYLDDALVDAVRVKLEPGKESGVTFDLASTDTARGSFRLVLDHEDQLQVDNTAYAALRPLKPSNVLLVTAGNKPLQKSVETAAVQSIANVQIIDPSVLLDPVESERLLQSGDVDLVIFDQCQPQRMPSANSLMIGTMPPAKKLAAGETTPSEATTSEWGFGEKTGPVNLIDLDRTHPMMEFLELGSVSIFEGQSVTPPEGGRVLMRADIGPVFAIAPRGPYQDAVLGFGVVRQTDKATELNTDWVRKRSFPLFVYGCIDYLSGGVTQESAATIQPGQPMALVLPSRFSEFDVVAPNGDVSTLEQTPGGQLVFTATESTGIYRVLPSKQREGSSNRSEAMTVDSQTSDKPTDKSIGKPIDVFTSNLFSPRESNIATVADLSIGGEKVTGLIGKSPTRIEYWRWILSAGLCLVVLEWFVYHRRH